jgi:hypothetical protein
LLAEYLGIGLVSTPRTASGVGKLGILDTIAIALLGLFCAGIIGVLWFDWRDLVREEADRYPEPRDSDRPQSRRQS